MYSIPYKFRSNTLVRKIQDWPLATYMVRKHYKKYVRHYRNIMYVLLISYVAGKQLITPMKAHPLVALAVSFPSSIVD